MADVSPLGSGFPDLDVTNATLARNWWAIALRGVIAVVFGLIALTVPGAALLTLALFFGAYLLMDGIIGVVLTVRAAGMHAPWGALLAEAVLNIVMGLIALVMPAAAVLAFVLLLAVWALVTGGLMLSAAFRVQVNHGRWWLALGGVASLLWGVMLVAAPMIGAVVVAWWLGIYAIIFGSALLAFAWTLRGRHIGAPGGGVPGGRGAVTG